MAGTWYTTKEFKYRLGSGEVNLAGVSANILKVILLTKKGAADPSVIPPASWKNFGYYLDSGTGTDGLNQFELSASGYTATGKALTSVTLIDISNANPIYKIDADDISWLNLDVSTTNGVYGFAIIDTSVTALAVPKLAIGIYLYDTPQTFTTSNFKIQFSTDGILHI